MDEYDYLLVLIIFMLYTTVFMDVVSMFMVQRGSVDVEEYATSVLKWPKIVMLGIFGIIMFYFSFTRSATSLTVIAEFVIGALLIADCIISAIVKKKHGGKK